MATSFIISFFTSAFDISSLVLEDTIPLVIYAKKYVIQGNMNKITIPIETIVEPILLVKDNPLKKKPRGKNRVAPMNGRKNRRNFEIP